MNGFDDYITDDPKLADYCIIGYHVTKDNDAEEMPDHTIINLLKTKEIFWAENSNVVFASRNMYTNIDVAFTELDRMTQYGELHNEDDNYMFLLYQAYNTDRPKLIRFWKYDTLYINGVDYTIDPYGNPIPRTY